MMLVRSSAGVTARAAQNTGVLAIFTLVPFAGSNLIRFRGSRINGLSPIGHSDKKTFLRCGRSITGPKRINDNFKQKKGSSGLSRQNPFSIKGLQLNHNPFTGD